MNKNIWQLKIQCCDASKKCEVYSTYTLEDLCSFILKSFNFDNDHLHKFYLSRSGRPYGQDVIEISSSRKIHDIFPIKDNKSLFLLFDFGDEWVFKISKTIKKVIFDSNKHYSIITEEKGVNPQQYRDYEE
jgi:hypothetical protein